MALTVGQQYAGWGVKENKYEVEMYGAPPKQYLLGGFGVHLETVIKAPSL